nr:hypothetical protein [Tanacetum cinerariifolium]
TQHNLPKKSESAFAKPDHMIASRNSSKNMPRFSSNDMVHIHYLDEATKKTQERDRNSKPSVMTPARFQSTTADSKPKPRSTNHSSRSLPMSKSSCVMMPAMPTADHSMSPISFSDHTRFYVLHIFTGHKSSPNKTSTVYNKISPRSDLRWQPTGRIFKSVGLRWLPIGLFNSCTNKVESEPPHGSNVDISKIHEYKQTLDLSTGTPINVLKEQSLDVNACILWNVNKENLRVWLLQKLISQKPLSNSDPAPECQTMALNHDNLSPAIQRQENVPQVDRTVTTSNELDMLFSLMFDELLNGSSKVVSKSSAVSAALQMTSLSTYSLPRYKTKGRRRHVMLIRQICTLSINDFRLNTVGQKIIH